MADTNAHSIEVCAEVRYWEDASVNGVDDTDGTLIPFRIGNLWKPLIRLSDGYVIGWPEGTVAIIHYKVCDQGEYWLTDEQQERIAKWKGSYVPDDFLCHGVQGYGDYIIFEVGADGKIAGWALPDIVDKEWLPLTATPPADAALADEIEWPVYHAQGMGCGIEDRCITDRYEACAYGFQEAVDQCAQAFDNWIQVHYLPAAAALRARAVPEAAPSEAIGKIDQNSYTTGWNDCQQQIGDDRMPGIRYSAEYLRDRVNTLRLKGVSLSVIDIADMLATEVERLVPYGTSGFGDASMNDTAMLAASKEGG